MSNELYAVLCHAFLVSRCLLVCPSGNFRLLFWFQPPNLPAFAWQATGDISAKVLSTSEPSAWRLLVLMATSIQGQATRWWWWWWVTIQITDLLRLTAPILTLQLATGWGWPLCACCRYLIPTWIYVQSSILSGSRVELIWHSIIVWLEPSDNSVTAVVKRPLLIALDCIEMWTVSSSAVICVRDCQLVHCQSSVTAKPQNCKILCPFFRHLKTAMCLEARILWWNWLLFLRSTANSTWIFCSIKCCVCCHLSLVKLTIIIHYGLNGDNYVICQCKLFL